MGCQQQQQKKRGARDQVLVCACVCVCVCYRSCIEGSQREQGKGRQAIVAKTITKQKLDRGKEEKRESSLDATKYVVYAE